MELMLIVLGWGTAQLLVVIIEIIYDCIKNVVQRIYPLNYTPSALDGYNYTQLHRTSMKMK